jgi:hypothetical protein
MIFKLIYLILFLSLDVLLYLFLVKKIIKAGYGLIVTTVIWLIVFLAHLPTFHLTYLMPIKDFITLSAMVMQLVIIHYVGLFVIRITDRSQTAADVKKYIIEFLSFAFNTFIFIFFIVVHLIFILVWPA